MSRIAVALPYAVSIRDFVHSGTLQTLIEGGRHELTIYTLNPALPELSAARNLGVLIRELQPYSDTRLEELIKRLYPLFFTDCFAYVAQTLEPYLLRRLFARACVILRRVIGPSKLLAMIASALRQLNRKRNLPHQLAQGTELLIGTRSLVNSLDYGIMAEAAGRGIPMLTLAGSWDNFTTKGYFPFPVVKTVVWNRKMSEELIDLFAVPAKLIAIAGYPRATVLRSLVSSLAAQAYLKELNITGFSRFILYSASYSELTRIATQPLPLEYIAIREVCKELSHRLPKDTCVLIRLHPFSRHEDDSCFADLDNCFVITPGRQDRYVERVMNREDERHLAMQISKSVCVISMASTMTIDALCLAKPILNIAYDPVPGLTRQQSIRRFYEYNHFKDLVRIAQLPLANTVGDVVNFVSDCLAGNWQSGVDHMAFEQMYVPAISQNYPQHVCSFVNEALNP